MKGNLVLNATSVFRGEVEMDPEAGRKHCKPSPQEDIMVCLTCTKKECGGGDECFRQRKRKLRSEDG